MGTRISGKSVVPESHRHQLYPRAHSLLRSHVLREAEGVHPHTRCPYVIGYPQKVNPYFYVQVCVA